MLGCHRRIRSGDGARPLTVPHGSFGIRRHSSLMLARAQPCSAQSAFPALKRASSAAVRPGSGSPILRGGPVTDALAHAAKSRTMGSLIRGLRTVKLLSRRVTDTALPPAAPWCPPFFVWKILRRKLRLFRQSSRHAIARSASLTLPEAVRIDRDQGCASRKLRNRSSQQGISHTARGLFRSGRRYTFRASQSSNFNWDLRFSLVLLRATKERPMAPAPPRRSTGR